MKIERAVFKGGKKDFCFFLRKCIDRFVVQLWGIYFVHRVSFYQFSTLGIIKNHF